LWHTLVNTRDSVYKTMSMTIRGSVSDHDHVVQTASVLFFYRLCNIKTQTFEFNFIYQIPGVLLLNTFSYTIHAGMVDPSASGCRDTHPAD